MKAGSYLSLARNYSFVVILLMFIGIEGTRTYVENNQYVPEARYRFVQLLMKGFQWPEEPEQGMLEILDFGGSEPMRYKIVGIKTENSQESDAIVISLDVRLDVDGPHPWSTNAKAEIVKGKTETNLLTSSDNDLEKLRTLQRSAVGKIAQIPPGASPLQEAEILRKEIESNALDRSTSMPGLGLEFRNGIAPWFIALTVLGLTIQIRNQVRRALLDPELALSEPWLVLDGRRGLEKAAAAVWVCTILLAPWVAAGCLIAVLSIDVPSGGWKLVDLCVIPLMFIGGWASLTASGDILRLRRLRLEKIVNLQNASI